MRLYYAKGTISIAVAIALQEAKLDWEPVRVDFASGEQTKPDYLAVNPKGRVPALQLDDGQILTETGALLDYVAASAPDAGLIPADAANAAHMRGVMYYLASTMHVNHAHGMRGSRWADKQESWDDMKAKVPETMRASAAFVAAECLRGDYVLGGQFSIADPYLFVVCNWLEGDGVSLHEFPKISDYLKRMEARDSVKFVRAEGML